MKGARAGRRAAKLTRYGPRIERPLLAAANAAIRLGYGVAVLTRPSRPVGGVELAPDTDAFPAARLFVRGFAAHQLGVGALGLIGLRSRDSRRAAMELAAATDLLDIVSALVEARAREDVGRDVRGGIAFSAAGLASALLARGW